MAHPENGAALGQEARDYLRYQLGAFRVEVGVRLVEQEHIGACQGGAQQGDPRGLTDGEAGRLMLKLNLVKPDAVESETKLRVGRGCLGGANLELPGVQKVVTHGARAYHRFLRHKRDAASPERGRDALRWRPVQKERPFATGKQASQRAKKCGLARAARTHDIDKLSAGHAERDAIEQGWAARAWNAKRQVLGGKRRHDATRTRSGQTPVRSGPRAPFARRGTRSR